MRHFPIFVDTKDKRILISGGGPAAIAKLRLLLKSEAALEVFACHPSAEIKNLAVQGKLTLHTRDLDASDAVGATLIYGADENAAKDAGTAAIAIENGVLFNIVDNLNDSAFITPAIVDRDPVTIAIGTEGAAPVLARAIKRDLEEKLPVTLGTLARVGKAARAAADVLPFGAIRRAFWQAYYFDRGPKALASGGERAARGAIDDLIGEFSVQRTIGHVDLAGAGPGDPELLTLKVREALDKADVVIHDRLISPEILELARREATIISVGKEGFGPSTPQDEINNLIVEHTSNGSHVVRLKSGDPTMFGRLDEEIEALDEAGISYAILPGITSASAAVAAINQSQTRRGRNSSIRYLTGHDVKGFADHEWRALARPGEVAAIYMGKRAARYVQGRLLMHGAVDNTPITAVENVSRADQRIVRSTLGSLAGDLEDAKLSGPAVILLGIAPRTNSATVMLKKEFA